METRTYRTVNIPPETWEEAAKRTSDYTIAFGKLTEQAVVDADLGGSGTLVKVDGKHGILTAAHVLDQIWKSERFALVLPGFPSGHPHTLLFETASLKKVQVSRPMHLDVSEPPDLALVELPPHQVGNISARKSFYNISKHQNEALSAPPECRLGFWVMSGFASEWTADAAATPGCARLVVVNGRILGVSVIPLQTDSEFDGWRGLFERGEDYDGPESFGGYSGGGLWQNLIEEKDGQIHWTRSLLSGVAFHQSRFKDNRNIVRFSGRRCIYEDLVNALRT